DGDYAAARAQQAPCPRVGTLHRPGNVGESGNEQVPEIVPIECWLEIRARARAVKAIGEQRSQQGRRLVVVACECHEALPGITRWQESRLAPQSAGAAPGVHHRYYRCDVGTTAP